MDESLVRIATFATGTLAVFGLLSLAGDLLLRDRACINQRLAEEFRDNLRERVRRSLLPRSLGERPADSLVPAWERLPGRLTAGLWTRLQIAVEQSGLRCSCEQLVGTAACAAVSLLLVGLLTGLHWAAALSCSLGGFGVPFAFLWLRRKRRLEVFCRQLPEAFDLMSRAVRAGQTISAALQLVAREGKPPISEEFAWCCEQQNLGLPLEVTLHDLARRNPIIELQMFVVALLVQRQSGGNPIEVLHNLADTIRKRVRLAGKVKALTSEGRMQAVVLSILPLLAFAVVYVLKRSYAEVLLERPELLFGTLGAQVIGVLWIRRMINFDY